MPKYFDFVKLRMGISLQNLCIWGKHMGDGSGGNGSGGDGDDNAMNHTL